ncbi:MAG: dienelactone hydrolase family protein [Pseudomonadota bacterium]
MNTAFSEKRQIPLTLTPIKIKAGDGIILNGDLTIPDDCRGMVIFAHGSGSSRHSPRNQAVATSLNEDLLGTLLIDLLTEEEERIDQVTRHIRFDIPLLAERLVKISNWVSRHPQLKGLKQGYFGSSTGAGAALIAAARLPDTITAVVSRGGRPDLAGVALTEVEAPVLLIVGALDREVLQLNETALKMLNTKSTLQTIPGATHLFIEEDTLQQAADAAAEWFVDYATDQQ